MTIDNTSEGRDMKVLWVCNIMLPTIARQLGTSYSSREGWLSGLLERYRSRGGIVLNWALRFR